jgi:predicted DNA-binding protein
MKTRGRSSFGHWFSDNLTLVLILHFFNCCLLGLKGFKYDIYFQPMIKNPLVPRLLMPGCTLANLKKLALVHGFDKRTAISLALECYLLRLEREAACDVGKGSRIKIKYEQGIEKLVSFGKFRLAPELYLRMTRMAKHLGISEETLLLEAAEAWIKPGCTLV